MFFDDEDREFFLSNLLFYSQKHALGIASYCLMDNHTHLAVVPENPDSLSRTLKPVHMRYSEYLNKKFRRGGINWQGRFFSSPLNTSQSFSVFQYIGLKPIKARLVADPSQYRWSSVRAHLNLAENELLTANKYWLDLAHSALEALGNIVIGNESSQDEEIYSTIERNVQMNLPVGCEKFIKALEKRTGLTLSDKARGRPRKG